MRPSRSPSGSTPVHVTSPAPSSVSSMSGVYEAQARRQDFTLEQRGHDRDALQLLDHVEQPVEAGARPRQAVPRHQEAAEGRGIHRLDLLSQLRERSLPHVAQHFGVAPFAAAAPRPELAIGHAAGGAQAHQRRIDHGAAQAQARAQIAAGKWPVRARIPAHEVADRIGDRLEQRLGQAGRQGCAQAVAIARGVFNRDQARLPRDAHLDGAPLGRELRTAAPATPGRLRAAISSRDRSPRRSSRSCTASVDRA
jgi:hypothetical protein